MLQVSVPLKISQIISKMSSAKKIVIFDLDGTIIDTIADIAAAVNRALASFGFPARTVAEIQSFLGNGSLMLMRRALGGEADDELCLSVRARFRTEYETGMFDLTRAYDGIAEMMQELRLKGAVIAVVTNKDDRCAVPMIKHFFSDLVQVCRGVRGDNDRKPNPEVTLNLLAEHGFTPDEALFVGDGMADLNVSKNANIDYIPVGYGYTSSEKLFSECGKNPCPDVESLRRELISYFNN